MWGYLNVPIVIILKKVLKINTFLLFYIDFELFLVET